MGNPSNAAVTPNPDCKMKRNAGIFAKRKFANCVMKLFDKQGTKDVVLHVSGQYIHAHRRKKKT